MSNVLLCISAQSSRGVLCFIRSLLAAASFPSLASSSPACLGLEGAARLPAMHSEKLVFAQAVEALFVRALGPRLTREGRASMALVTKLGPRRSLERVPHHVRAGNNFNEVRLEEVGPDSATLWMRDVTADNPFFACGFLAETLRTSGAGALVVTASAG